MRLCAQLWGALVLSLAVGAAVSPWGMAGAATQAGKQEARVRPAPRYRPGQTLRYQIDSRTQSSSHSAGAVENPQGASQIELELRLLVRIEVLSTVPAVAEGPAQAASAAAENPNWRARLRATYEKSTAVVRGDSYDPSAGDLEAQFRQLQGRAVEFTLEAGGKVEEVAGLEEILHDQKSLSAVRTWLSQLAAGTEFPREGIAPGESWIRERPVAESPLENTVIETHSTYVRNEKCRADAKKDGAVSSPPAGDFPVAVEMCAVILTQYEMKQQGKTPRSKHDAESEDTPEELRRRGLHSSGAWTSAGESLAYLSLATGLTLSVTQSGAEDMNLTVRRSTGGPPYHYEAKTRSETHLTLLPEPAAPARPSGP